MIRFTVMAAAYVERCNPQVLIRNVAGMDRVEAIVEQFRQLPSAPVPQPPRRRRRWWFLLALVPLVIVAALAVRPAADVVTQPSAVTDWRAEVQRIDAIRMRAFMKRDPELLLSILAVGSPAYVHDLTLIQDMEVRRVVLDRDPVELVSVQLRGQSVVNGVERVQLDVVDRLAAHAFVVDSTTVSHNGGRGKRRWLLELRRRGDAAWRLYSATAGASTPSIRASDQGN